MTFFVWQRLKSNNNVPRTHTNSRKKTNLTQIFSLYLFFFLFFVVVVDTPLISLCVCKSAYDSFFFLVFYSAIVLDLFIWTILNGFFPSHWIKWKSTTSIELAAWMIKTDMTAEQGKNNSKKILCNMENVFVKCPQKSALSFSHHLQNPLLRRVLNIKHPSIHWRLKRANCVQLTYIKCAIEFG